jgi:S-adenosylmethionine:tRNA ribosyltransferase-isomerase
MEPEFNFESYQYDLPTDQIAQFPAATRDRSRLFVIDCKNNSMQDRKFTDILDYIQEGDLLVVNDTKVFPARLEGRKDTGGKIELFLLEYPDFYNISEISPSTGHSVSPKRFHLTVTGLLKSSKRPKVGSLLFFNHAVEGKILQFLAEGKVSIRLYFSIDNAESPEEILMQCGRIPLPPYIQRENEDHPDDRGRYQTLFARKSGAVAAPTAGLHFSEELLQKLHKRNIQIVPITLHVGYGTFAPVRVTDIRQHKIHEEYVEVSAQTADLINKTRKAGKKIWTVGTTTARTLEFAADEHGQVKAKQGWCGLYIYPGYEFKVVTGLITNFHLPGSSLLFLVAALAGRSNILRAYHKAIQLGYRFYSYGDAMLIIP